MATKAIDTLIFDLDGTLADTMPDLMTAMNGMRTHYGFSLLTREDLLSCINHGAREFVRLSLPEDKRDNETLLNEALDIYSECYSHCYADKTQAYPGMLDALRALRAAGKRLAVLSNKQDSFVKVIIAKLFPEGLFDEVWGQEKFPPKPNPAAAHDIAARMGVTPEQIIFVGDSDVDIKTAVNAGMTPLGVTWGYRGEDVLRQHGARHFAHTTADIPAVVAEIEKG